MPDYRKDAGRLEFEEILGVAALRTTKEGDSLFHRLLKVEDIGEVTAWLAGLQCYGLTYDRLDDAIKAVQTLVDPN